MKNKRYFISENTPSSKNSKVWTGRFLVWSKTALRYRRNTKEQWEKNAQSFATEYWRVKVGDNPVKISFKFIRGSKHKFDYPNPLQTVLDLMVEFSWIPDDNMECVLPIFELYEYSKENPGVYIQIIN